MSETVVMAESSSYRDSINFYDRMSHLQGELKNYESQQFQLEEEFQRLWTQGISLQSPTKEALGPVPSSSSIHLVEKDFGHLTVSKSQLLSNSPNLNYGKSGEEAEHRRRARNQAILEKLQELETNASAFAARSERLRMMRNEYETLVRKYTSSRKGSSSMAPASSRPEAHYSSSQSFLSRSSPSEKTGANVTSTGVNTDITGPVRPFEAPRDALLLLPERSLNIESPRRQAYTSEPEKLLSATPNSHKESTDEYQKKKDEYEDEIEDEFASSTSKVIKPRPTFLDISSTSESDFQLVVPKLKEYQLDNLDDTSADTTSLSVLMPKSRGSNYMLNISTDGSLSETTSIKQPPIRKTILKKNLANANNNDTMATTTTATSTSKTRDTRDGGGESKGNDKLLINSTSNVPAKSPNVYEDEEESSSSSGSSSDSTSNSIGDSVMDSVQNKTPDSLPKDDSELLHITEVDEEEEDEAEDDDKDMVEDQHASKYHFYHEHQRGESNEQSSKSSALIDEMGNQNQETWDNLSSSNLVREAQKEIEIRNFGETKVNQSEDMLYHQQRGQTLRSSVVDSSLELSTINNKVQVDNNKNSLVRSGGKQNMTNDTTQQNILKDPLRTASRLSLQSATSSSSLSSIQVENKNGKTVEDGLRIVQDKLEESTNKENLSRVGELQSPNHDKKLEVHNKSKSTRDDDFSSQPIKDFNTDATKQSPSSQQNPFLVTPSQKESKQNGKTGNESKKLRLKFDYDDSEESEHSAEAAPIKTSQSVGNSWDNLKSNNKKDDLFDDFFDV